MADMPAAGVLYLRQSEDRAGDSLAITRQQEDCRAAAAARGINIIAVLADNDTSAAGRKRRPAFEELLRMVTAAECKAVIAWDMTRLTRNRADTVRLIEGCMQQSAVIVLARGSDLDMGTPAGRLTAELLASIARHEIEVKGDRQSRALEQAARLGLWVGGRRPFGFEPDGMTLREAEADAVANGYQLIATGATLAEVARIWNAAGLTPGQATRDGRPSAWRHDNVRAVLLNPRYVGDRYYKGEHVAAAKWPAIVTRDMFGTVRAILTDPARKTGPTSARRLLTGLALCAACGATVHAGGAVHRYPTYRCSTADPSIKGHVIRKAEPIEEYVKWLVIAWCMRPDVKARIALSAPSDAGRMAADRNAAGERLKTAGADYADDLITREQLRTITRRLRAKITQLDAGLAATAHTGMLLTLIAEEDIEVAWDGLTTGQQRTLVGALMTIRLKGPGRGVREVRREDVLIDWQPSARAEGVAE